MNVKLVVTNPYNSDSIVKEGYIDVKAVVSPNPSKGTVSILTDINNTEGINIDVFDAVGKLAQHYQYKGSSSSSYNITLPDYGNMFIIRIIQGDQVQTHKVIVVH
jgi:PKD repeat protein